MEFTRDNFTSPRGRFFSLKEKIADNFTSPRNLAWEGHVSPARPVFPRSRSSSPMEEVAEKEKSVRCIIPPVFLLVKGGIWHNTKNFPKCCPGPRR